MRVSVSGLFICALLPVFGIAAPAAGSGGKGNGGNDKTTSRRSTVAVTSAKASSTSIAGDGGSGNGPSSSTNSTGANGVSDKQIANAVVGWMTDTGKVTKFLNTATSFTGDEYTKQATIAFNAEVDELNHKAVLDVALDPATIKAANDTLVTKGSFQAVVDSLQAMVNEGPDTAQARVNEINNNRCVNVLPNINMYFAAAGAPDSSAFVPTGCLEVALTNSAGVAQNTQVLPNPTTPPSSSSLRANSAVNLPTKATSSAIQGTSTLLSGISSSAASNARATSTRKTSASKSPRAVVTPMV